jgi:hypothetical protein
MFRTARFALVLLCSALAGAQDDSLAGSFLSGMSPRSAVDAILRQRYASLPLASNPPKTPPHEKYPTPCTPRCHHPDPPPNVTSLTVTRFFCDADLLANIQGCSNFSYKRAFS